MKRIACLTTLFSLVVVGAGPPAVGNHLTRASYNSDSARDADDAASRLDIRYVAFKGLGRGRATLTIRTAEAWSCDLLRLQDTPLGAVQSVDDGAMAWLVWDFNGDRNDYQEPMGTFTCEGDGKFVFTISNEGHATLEGDRFAARKTDRRTIVTTIRLTPYGLDNAGFEAQARSVVTGIDNGHPLVDETDLSPVLKPVR